ncbi:unnamed protein product [Phaeothamnion confervicola]
MGEAVAAPVETRDWAGLAFEAVYALGSRIGSGAFGICFECVHRASGARRAVKIVNRPALNEEDRKALEDEIGIMRALDHPNCVPLVEVFGEFDGSLCYIVMPRMEGGEIFARIIAKTALDEAEARSIAVQTLSAIDYMHSKGYIHLDVKPENVLYENDENGELHVKLCDFGFAERADPAERSALLPTRGTPQYVAPEILLGNEYGTKVDVWAVGVLVYVMLGGYPPFHAQCKRRLFRNIVHGNYKFHTPFWDKVSPAALSFICTTLQTDAAARPTAAELLQHPWLQSPTLQDGGGDDAAAVPRSPPFCPLRAARAAAAAAAAAVAKSVPNVADAVDDPTVDVSGSDARLPAPRHAADGAFGSGCDGGGGDSAVAALPAGGSPAPIPLERSRNPRRRRSWSTSRSISVVDADLADDDSAGNAGTGSSSAAAAANAALRPIWPRLRALRAAFSPANRGSWSGDSWPDATSAAAAAASTSGTSLGAGGSGPPTPPQGTAAVSPDVRARPVGLPRWPFKLRRRADERPQMPPHGASVG